MIRNPPPSPNSLLPTRDLIDEIVPTTVTYIVPSDPPAWLDYREAMKAEIEAVYGDRPICYCDADHWVKIIKREFSPEALSTLGKQVVSINRIRNLILTTSHTRSPRAAASNHQPLRKRRIYRMYQRTERSTFQRGVRAIRIP